MKGNRQTSSEWRRVQNYWTHWTHGVWLKNEMTMWTPLAVRNLRQFNFFLSFFGYLSFMMRRARQFWVFWDCVACRDWLSQRPRMSEARLSWLIVFQLIKGGKLSFLIDALTISHLFLSRSSSSSRLMLNNILEINFVWRLEIHLSSLKCSHVVRMGYEQRWYTERNEIGGA